MGRFFREFDDAPQSSSFLVLLLGMAMFGGMAWIVTAVVNGSPMDSIQAIVTFVQERLAQ